MGGGRIQGAPVGWHEVGGEGDISGWGLIGGCELGGDGGDKGDTS